MNALVLPPMQFRAWLRIEDFLLLQNSGALADRKTELIEGELLVMNAQFVRHAYAKSLLHLSLDRGLRAAGSDLVVVIEASVAMPPFDLPEPDLIVTAVPRQGGPVPVGSVALLIEVADTTQRFDLGRKAFVYARNRVPEYWVVDLAAKQIIRHWAPDTAGYGQSDSTAFGSLIASATIDGLAVATGELLGLPDSD